MELNAHPVSKHQRVNKRKRRAESSCTKAEATRQLGRKPQKLDRMFTNTDVSQ
jgi:hypothetical protein